MTERIELRDPTGAVATVIPGLGGWLLRYARPVEGHGLVDALRDDEAVVARYPKEMWAGNPLLFPVVSYTHLPGAEHHYEWAGQRYPLPQHGFARRSPWTVVERSESAVTLELTDTEATRAAFPFAFRYALTYRLDSGRLHWDQVIENRSAGPMPFGAGFHPYFRLPLGSASKRNDCHVRCPRGMRYNPVGLAEAFFNEPFPEQDVPVARDVSGTLLLGDLAAREFALVDTAAGLEVVLNWDASPAYRFCALWSRTPSENFYCIEPWTALPNAFSRPDDRELVILAPGESFRASMWMEVRAAAATA
jgi:galactose mutarotase-like enzyme